VETQASRRLGKRLINIVSRVNVVQSLTGEWRDSPSKENKREKRKHVYIVLHPGIVFGIVTKTANKHFGLNASEGAFDKLGLATPVPKVPATCELIVAELT
jgi:hypothetical protein